MRERFSNRQIVVIVACICAAIAGGPVSVLAATGQLVNITDPETARYKVQVASSGRMAVHSQSADVNVRLYVGDICGSKSATGTELVNVAPYREVRVATTAITASGNNTVYVAAHEPGEYVSILDSFTQPSGGHASRLYAVPGRQLHVYCGYGAPSDMQVVIWGRR